MELKEESCWLEPPRRYTGIHYMELKGNAGPPSIKRRLFELGIHYMELKGGELGVGGRAGPGSESITWS